MNNNTTGIRNIKNGQEELNERMDWQEEALKCIWRIHTDMLVTKCY